MTPPPLKLRWTGLLVAYARERLTAVKLVPAVLLVVLAALAGRGWAGGLEFATDVLLALALVVAFRICDDLVDRERDRTKHPERVIVRASPLTGLRVVGGILAFGATIALLRTHGDGSAYLIWLYATALGLSYRWRRSSAAASTVGRTTVAKATLAGRTAAGDRILLLKYGVFTLALIGFPAGSTPRGLLAAAAAFVAACVYEWWHDAESPVFSFGGSR
jgi:4-hydroxybenzoate polyprenyltransferase